MLFLSYPKGLPTKMYYYANKFISNKHQSDVAIRGLLKNYVYDKKGTNNTKYSKTVVTYLAINILDVEIPRLRPSYRFKSTFL